MTDKGPNDLESIIERLEFRNAKLHQHNEKIELEIIEIRRQIKRLEKEVEFYAKNQFKNTGAL